MVVFLLKVTVTVVLVVVVTVVSSSEVLLAQGFVKQVQIDVSIDQGLLIKQLLLAKKVSPPPGLENLLLDCVSEQWICFDSLIDHLHLFDDKLKYLRKVIIGDFDLRSAR